MHNLVLSPIDPNVLTNDIADKVVSRVLKAINERLVANADKWFTLNELVDYDPEKRAKQTFYGLVSRGAIPYHKRGKKLTFLKSEIDFWLRSASRVSASDLETNKGA